MRSPTYHSILRRARCLLSLSVEPQPPRRMVDWGEEHYMEEDRQEDKEGWTPPQVVQPSAGDRQSFTAPDNLLALALVMAVVVVAWPLLQLSAPQIGGEEALPLVNHEMCGLTTEGEVTNCISCLHASLVPHMVRKVIHVKSLLSSGHC